MKWMAMGLVRHQHSCERLVVSFLQQCCMLGQVKAYCAYATSEPVPNKFQAQT